MPVSIALRILFTIIVFFHFACGNTPAADTENEQSTEAVQQQEDSSKPTMSADSFFLLHYPDYHKFKSPLTASPMDFVRALADTTARLTLADQSTIPIPHVYSSDDFPANWITTIQMDSIMPLIHSQKKCKCYVSHLSSYLPASGAAEVGGFVIELAEAFKNKEPLNLGLWSCPKYDAGKAKRLSTWWAQHRLDSINQLRLR